MRGGLVGTELGFEVALTSKPPAGDPPGAGSQPADVPAGRLTRPPDGVAAEFPERFAPALSAQIVLRHLANGKTPDWMDR